MRLRALTLDSPTARNEVHHATRSGSIKNHLSHIFAKLGVQDRTSATVTALRRGLVRLE